MARQGERAIRWWVGILIRQRTIFCGLAILLSMAALYPATHLDFDRRVESLYSEGDPYLEAYEKSQEWFGGDEIAFLGYTDPDLESSDSRNRLLDLARRVAAVPGIDPNSVQDYWSAMRGSRIPLVSIPEDELRAMMQGVLLGDDGQTTAVVMRFESEAKSPIPRSETIERLKKIAADFPLPTALVGEPILVQESFRYVEEDGLWLWIYSSGLLTVVILMLLGDFRWALLSVAVVFTSVLWTRGMVGVIGANLSMVSSVLNSLVTVIGVATVIHIALKYQEKREGEVPGKALAGALEELTVPIFWTTLTTSLGFFVLISSSIRPVQTFGIIMTLGTLSVYPAIAFLVPFGVLSGGNSMNPAVVRREDWLARRMRSLSRQILSYPKQIWAVSLILTGFTGLGFAFLKVETDFSKNFREATPIVQGLNFMESKLGGTGNWEVNFPAPHELDSDYLNNVRKLSEDLEELKQSRDLGLTKVIALSDAVDLVPRIPLVSFTLSRRLSILRKIQPDLESSLYNPSEGRMRIVLRSLERMPSQTKVELMRQVKERARKYFPEAEVTGMYVILTYLIDNLMFDQWLSFVLSSLAILVQTGIAFRSAWLGLISLVPNVFPNLMVMGVMGWIGLPINMATAMMASVSMGLTVDSGILFLWAFQSGRRAGLSFDESLDRAQRGVGRAVLISNFALVAGFLVLSFSHFIPLVHFGLLVSVAMLGGLVGNLVLLPLMMRSGRSEWSDRYGFRPPAKSEEKTGVGL